MISRRKLLNKLGWRQKIDLNMDLTEYDTTLDLMIEEYAKPEEIKKLCRIFNVVFLKEEGLKTSKRELLIIFHNEPGLTALVVAPILLGMGIYLMAGSITLASVFSKLAGLGSIFSSDKLLNLSSKYSEENIKECRAIMTEILARVPKKTVIKEIKEIAGPEVGKSKKGGTRKRR